MVKDVIGILRPYCKKIRENGKHYVCYPLNSDTIITVAKSPSDRNWAKNLYLKWRRHVGVEIEALNNISK